MSMKIEREVRKAGARNLTISTTTKGVQYQPSEPNYAHQQRLKADKAKRNRKKNK